MEINIRVISKITNSTELGISNGRAIKALTLVDTKKKKKMALGFSKLMK